VKQHVLVSVGLISFVLGATGALMPVLPTTPFLLLSGYCFAHSSSKFDNWLKNTKLYQVYVSDYAETRTIPKNKKRKIVLNIWILMSISIFLAPITLIKMMLGLLTAGLTIIVLFVIPNRKGNSVLEGNEENTDK